MRRILLATAAALAVVLAGPQFAHAARRLAHRQGHLPRRRRDGRRGGERPRGRLDHPHQRRHRCARASSASRPAKLDPGHYTITIRAAGYDLDGAGAADVAAGKTATADLKLKKTQNLAAQLTNADWMTSLPDQPARRGLASCTTCHTVQRVLEFHPHRRRVHGAHPAHDALRRDVEAEPSADSGRPAGDQRAQGRRARAHGGILRQRQSQRRPRASLRAQDRAAPERPRDPRDHDRIRVAASRTSLSRTM